MPLNLDIFALMMLYEITLPAGVVQRISRREKQARRVSLLIAQVAQIATCTHVHGHIWITILLLKAWRIKADRFKTRFGSKLQILKILSQGLCFLTAILLSGQRACLLAQDFAARGWNQAGERTEMLRSCAKSIVHLSVLYCSGRTTLNKVLL